MKLDVLIPCHNSEHCIARALASVFHQTRTPDRVILHDDASVDRTPEIIRELADGHNATLIRSEHNIGILISRQRLVHESQADVLCFLDHDDEWPPDYLERVEKAFDNDVVATIAPARSIGLDGRTSLVRPRATRLRATDRANSIRTIFLQYPIPSWSCVAIRRTVAQRLTELPPFPSGEEFALLALAIEQGDALFLHDPPIDRHIAANNASLRPTQQHTAEMMLLSWFSSRYPELLVDVPAKITSIYANSIYRNTISGDVAAARACAAGLVRGILHRKALKGLVAYILGPRVVRWLRPPR